MVSEELQAEFEGVFTLTPVRSALAPSATFAKGQLHLTCSLEPEFLNGF